MTENRPEESAAAAVAEPQPAPAAPLPSPGALLRQARERAGIGAEDLAGQLKLAKGTLEALERDDFAALSEPVYVRGYYRKIAKLLPVKESELIDAYNAVSKTATKAVTPAKPARPAMQRIPLAGGVDAGASRHYRGQGIGIAIAVVVVVIIVIVVANREPPPPRLAETQPVEAPAPAPAETAPSPEGPAAMPAPTPSQAAPAPGTPTPGGSPAASAKSPPTPAPAPAPSAAKSAPGTTPPAASTAAAPTKPAAPAPNAPAAVANQLVMDLSESSFVRVEDNRGKTLAIGLVRAGERQTLDGQPPYSVFLGTAQNVKLWFNGQPVDFSQYINPQNGTARFTVP